MRKTPLYLLGLVVIVLVALGLIVLTSASEANAIRLSNDPYYFIKRQFVYLGGGLFVATIVALFDYHHWRDWPWLTWGVFILILAALGYVFHFDAVKGSHRWIRLVGSVRVQPSEIAKAFLVILLAGWLDRASWRVELFMRGAFWPFVLAGVFAVPILIEPDFGSVMVIGATTVVMLVVAGTRVLHMLPFILCGGAVCVYKIKGNANRMARLFDDSKQYQVKMALAAIGNSNIWGVGLGESMQKYLYLPEAHTDFVFAVGAEELGIVFSVSVFLLFMALLAVCVYIALKAEDRLGRFLVVGMTFILIFQAMFNLGVVCKAFPTKGMALPFFSYGGTNMLSAFFSIGTIFSVGIHSYRAKKVAVMRRVMAR